MLFMLPAGTANLQQVKTIVPDAFNSTLSNGERLSKLGGLIISIWHSVGLLN
jgi:hypothetical protein